MSDITLRLVKGSPLTNQEVDDNFANLNTDKYQAGDSASFQDVTLDNMTGPITWNTGEGALDIPLNAQVTLQAGQEFVFYAKATEAIANGDVVMFAGAQGGHLLIAKCDMGAAGFDPSHIVGIATQSFATNDFGYVTSKGKVRGIDTSSFAEGAILYVDPTTAGGFTATKPAPPNHIVQVAAVTRSHANQGTVLTRVSHMPDTDEVPEGSTNLYFTDARAVSAIKADGDWNASNWDSAFSWGDHSTEGYLTSIPYPSSGSWWNGYVGVGGDGVMEMGKYMDFHTSNTGGNADYDLRVTVSPGVFSVGGQVNATGGNSGQWNTAYGWGDHSTQNYATQTYVNNAVSNLVDSAPATLDTLNELAAALGDDPNFAATVTNSIGTKWTQDNTKISNWDTAYGWGNHASAGYLTSLPSHNHDGRYVYSDYINSGYDWNTFSYGSNEGVITRVESSAANPPATGVYNWSLYQQGDSVRGSQIAVSAYAGGNRMYLRTSNGGSGWNGWDRMFGDNYHPNADKWTTARTLSLTGDVTGSVSWDGSANASITTTVVNDSHTHDGRYVNVTGDTMTGALTLSGASDLNFRAGSNEDAGDIVWKYYNNTEKHRLWDGGTGLNYRYNGGPSQRIYHQAFHPEADKWTTARSHTVTLTGQVTGSATQSVDGTGNKTWTINTTVDDNALNDQFVQQLGITTNPDYLTPSSRRVEPNAGNPTSHHYAMMTYGNGANVTGQLATHFQTGATYNRAYNNSWSAWSRMFDDDYHPNADKWTTARTNTVTLTGDASGSGSASVDGTGNWTVSVPVVVNNDSHTHDGRYVNVTGDTMTGGLAMSGNNTVTFGPNSNWARYLTIGGNANNSTTTTASIGTTNGNLHIDAANGSFATYLNFYDGTDGVAFGGGNSAATAWMGADGDLWKGSSDNTGAKYWHAGNDGSGSGLDADLLDGKHLAQIARYQSSSDFPNGTLVTTNIPSSASSGSSFVIEITGKAYGSSRPHSVIAEGYIYNNTIINTAGTNLSGSNFTYLKVMNNGGYLSFWWPSHGYWNSYDVHVRDSSGGTQNYNRVTSIANSADPSGATKKIQINLATSWTSLNDGSGSGLDADLLDGQHGSYYAPASHSHDYVPERNRTDWNDSTVLYDVVGQMGWRNYGNNHTIFDASKSLSPSDTSVNNTNPGVPWSATYPTLMGWNGSSTYGVRVDSSRYSDQWKTSRTNTVTLTGDASGSGSASVDGTGNWTVSVPVVVANDSHNHSNYLPYGTGGAVNVNSLLGTVLFTGSTSGWPNRGPSAHNGGALLSLNTHPGSYYSQLWFDTGGSNFYHRTSSAATPTAAWRKVWDSGNDGSGSGLDADLLDGQHGSYYAPVSSIGNGTVTITTSGSASGGGTFTLNQSGNTTINISATDTNSTYNFSGSAFQSRNTGNVIAIDSATTNMSGYVNNSSAAGFSDGGAWVAAYSSSWVAQIFQNFRNGEITTRGKNNGTWQNWRKQWDSLNDGSGSGLDADLLDGVHASSFNRKDTNTQYLRPYYAYTDYLTTQSAYTLSNEMGGDGGIRVDFINGQSFGTWGHCLTWSGYHAYNMYQLSGYYHVSGQSDLWFRSEKDHTNDEWTAWNKIYHTGNDGSGSGLDADLLDGVQGSYFYSPSNVGPSNGVNITGYGNGNFTYHQASGAFNIHSGWHGYLISNHGDGSNYYRQVIALPFWGSPTHSRLEGGTQRGIYNMWTAENDGSGSGLDADLLDGVQGSGYARTDAQSNISMNSYDITAVSTIAVDDTIRLARDGFITFYGDASSQHGIGSRNEAGSSSDDIRINSYSGIHLNLDSNNNNSSSSGLIVGRHGGATSSMQKFIEVSGETCWTRFFDTSSGTGFTYMSFQNAGGTTTYGSIYRSYGNMVYATSSDYRLKENVVDLTNATTRINSIPVRRFNFIEHPDRTVDGFIAHEVAAVVPEAVVGTKDEVDTDGNAVYQGIDQGKLVPLLTAGLQEALAEIENLKARLSALENGE